MWEGRGRLRRRRVGLCLNSGGQTPFREGWGWGVLSCTSQDLGQTRVGAAGGPPGTPQGHVGTHMWPLRCYPESPDLAGQMGSEGSLVLWGVMMLEGLRDPLLTGPV